MKILLSDLKNFILNKNESNHIKVEDIQLLDKIGYEIDKIDDFNLSLEKFVVAEIKECSKVPDAEKLNLCIVTDGNQDYQIICGAHNVRVGLKVVLAKVNTIMPDGMMIKKAKIRGVSSSGMLCSARELGLSNEHDGIYELPKNSIIGDAVTHWIDCDTAIDVDITPDKIFANSILGMANELVRSEVFNSLPILDKFNNYNITDNSTFINANDIKLMTRHHSAHAAYWLKIEDVKNHISPNWLIRKLYLLGIKSHSLIVDMLNYITYITGQPLHVYDADKIKGSLKITSEREVKDFIGLDGEKYSIENDELIICDENDNICAIAGLIGSQSTSINHNTKNIIIEIAAFDMKFFQKNLSNTSKAYNLFSKGVSGSLTYNVLQYIINDILLGEDYSQLFQLTKNNIIGVDGWHYKTNNQKINFNIEIYKSLIGIGLDKERFVRLFNSNNFHTNQISENEYNITIAENRSDIIVQQDIVAEYLRFSNYDELPTMHIKKDFKDITSFNNEIEFRLHLAKLIARLGYDEVMTWSFGNKENNMLLDKNIIEIKNPINKNLSVLNISNYSNLLGIAESNLARLETEFKLFTIAPLFEDKRNNDDANIKKGINQSYYLSGMIHLGDKNKFHNKVNKVDFYDVKGDIELFLSEIGFNNAIFQSYNYSSYTHLYQTAKIIINHKYDLGVMTVLYPQDNLLFFELNIEVLFKFYKQRKSNKISDKHPIFRDFCFLMEGEHQIGDILNVINKINKVTKVELIDQHKINNTITVRIKIESDINIEKDDIKKIEDKLINEVKKKFNLSLKD